MFIPWLLRVPTTLDINSSTGDDGISFNASRYSFTVLGSNWTTSCSPNSFSTFSWLVKKSVNACFVVGSKYLAFFNLFIINYFTSGSYRKSIKYLLNAWVFYI